MVYICNQMRTNNDFNIAQSIQTIDAALQHTRVQKTDASFYYILWGIVLAVYFGLHFFSMHFFPEGGKVLSDFSWIVFPLGGILSGINKRRDNQLESAVGPLEKVYFWSFIGFASVYGIVTAVSIVMFNTLSLALFPLFLGSTVFIVGGISKHYAAVVLGGLSMLLAFVTLTSDLKAQYGLAAVSAVIAAIIPGILMRKADV